MSERLARYAEDATENQKCPMCNGPLDKCQDDHKAWYPQRLVCFKTLELISAQRRFAALHEARPYHDGSFEDWSDKQSDSHPFKYDDAVRLWVAEEDYDPDGDWLTR